MNDTTRLVSLSDVSELVSFAHSIKCSQGSDGDWKLTLRFNEDRSNPDTAEFIAKQLKAVLAILHNGDRVYSEY